MAQSIFGAPGRSSAASRATEEARGTKVWRPAL